MKTRYLINLLLVIVVITLYWFNSQPNSTTNTPYPALTSLTSQDINTIRITRANNTLLLKKQTSGWQLLEPVMAKANDTRIQLILSLLSTASFAQFSPENEADLTRFDINDSSIKVELNDQFFQFGAKESLSQHRYIFYRGMIHLIDDQVTPLLNANANSYIENRLLAANEAINTLSLPPIDGDNQLSQTNTVISQHAGHWQANNLNLSTDRLTTLIDSWQHAYATQVLPITKEQQTTLPQHQVEISFKNEPTPLTLSVSVNKSSLTIINLKSQLQYQFPISMLQQLFPSTDAQ